MLLYAVASSVRVRDLVKRGTGCGRSQRRPWGELGNTAGTLGGPACYEEALRKNLLSLATTKTRHIGDDPEVELYDPDLWTDEYAFLNVPGQAQIQSDLFYDYRTNVDAYPKWQAWLQKTQPKLLVLWGKHDLSFDLGEPERYRQDVPKAEVYLLDAGHFALDTKADQIAALVREFTTKEISETN
jgi:pimeloyl-ACP methyl ester carboxylesterase